MKIAILVSAFPPQVSGGTGIATYNTARQLVMLGHEVHVITTLSKGLPKESIEQGFHIHRVSLINKPILEATSFFINALFVIRRINPDLVHVQSTILALHGFLIKAFLRKPYLVYGRGSDIYLSSRFDRLLARLTLAKADAVIAQTNDMKDTMHKLCNRDILVIPNGVDADRFSNLSRKESRSKLNINGNDRVILFVGGLRLVKGVRYLIESMNIIRHEYQNIRLLIVGNGKERQNLENITEKLNLTECISFMGWVPNEAIQEYMAASDILVLPSLSEGFPVTILEAMASGLPIVCTKVGGMSEIVIDGENGYLIEPKNSMEIAEKVLLLLKNDNLKQRMSENNRQRAKRYSWEGVARNLGEVYTKVI